eukprot:TRINITY_DN8751_c0_g1_i1.p1 TRINITY_DN8751_c0_g1~~TRINITY_DN8751_c0_g1_i1.p1  ORF type:complete len:700 (+),score=142.34 TRINITY_DN8751_c0_g1_i1:109-2208(+)
MSSRVLLQWLNEQLDTNMTKIVEMSEGWQYCQLLHILFDREVPMGKVVLKARNEEQRLANFKVVMNMLSKKGADFPSGDIDIQKLAKGQQTHNLSFLNWFKRWYDTVLDGEDPPEYNASRVRSQHTYSTARTPTKTPTSSRRKRSKPEPLPKLNLNADPEGSNYVSTPGFDANENPAMFFLQKKRSTSTNPTKRHKPIVSASSQITITETAVPTPPEASRPEPRKVERPHVVSMRDESTLKQLREDNRRLEKSTKELETKLLESIESSRGLTDKAKEAEKQVHKLKDDKQQLTQELKNIREKMATLQRDVLTASNQLREKEATLSQAEQVRKMLHNSLQELKGNIRVFARLRPSLGDEEVNNATYGFPDKLDFRKITVQEADTTSAIGTSKPGKLSHFEFDRAFGPNSTQEDIFGEVSQMVHSAMDGYKVCIFAYGQTGSGKTFTMEGGAGSQMGLIPRTVELLFQRSSQMTEFGWELKLSLRYVEIYNEKIRDLLSEDGGELLAAMDKKIEIHHSKETGDTYLTNCTVVPVHSIEGVHEALRLAGSRRTVSATKMNDSSSRSHSVFTLMVQGRNVGIDQNMHTEINLIDLAGSERVKDSGVTGEALKEAEHINTSLTHLGNVIQALHAARKNAGTKSHIFRNSPLTWMLKPCLGGDCKTLMMVNISPVATSVSESINSLRFATKVNNCQIGSASRRLK